MIDKIVSLCYFLFLVILAAYDHRHGKVPNLIFYLLLTTAALSTTIATSIIIHTPILACYCLCYLFASFLLIISRFRPLCLKLELVYFLNAFFALLFLLLEFNFSPTIIGLVFMFSYIQGFFCRKNFSKIVENKRIKYVPGFPLILLMVFPIGWILCIVTSIINLI